MSSTPISRYGLHPSTSQRDSWTVRPGDSRGASSDTRLAGTTARRTKWIINDSSQALTIEEAEALEEQRRADAQVAEQRAREERVVRQRSIPRNIPEKHRRAYEKAVNAGIAIYARDEDVPAELGHRSRSLDIVESAERPEVAQASEAKDESKLTSAEPKV